MISPTPNPQPGGPGSPYSLAPPLQTCPAWVTLPGAKAPAGIALRFIRAHKPLNHRQGRTTERGKKTMLYDNFTTEAVQYGIESEEKAVAVYIKDMSEKEITVKMGL